MRADTAAALPAALSAAEAAESAITVRGLTVVAGGRAIVDAVSLDIARGGFHGLLGPNGAGKSTLLRVLYRAQAAATGTITIDGRPLPAWPRRAYAAHAGALVQEGAALQGLSVREVARLGLLPLRLPAGEAERRVRDALALTELDGLGTRDAGQLSGGERQRLFFAQLLALDPAIYLLDEPNNHLDLYFQLTLLDEIKRRGRTVIASFHDLALAARYCDRALLMQDGRVVASGPLNAVITPHWLRTVYRVDGRLSGQRPEIAGPVVG